MQVKDAQELASLYHNTSFLDKLHIYIRLRRAYFDKVETYLPKQGTILDFGCGHGFFSYYLAKKSSHRNIIGVDISRKKIDMANAIEHKTITFLYKENTVELLEKKNEYDGIAILNVLYLFDKKGEQEVIEKAAKALKKDGVLALIEHDANITFTTRYTRLREFFMLRIFKLTSGETLTFNPHEWWMALLEKYFSQVIAIKLDKKGFQKLYICKK